MKVARYPEVINKTFFDNSIQILQECVLLQLNLSDLKSSSKSSLEEVNKQVDLALKDTEKYLRWRRSCYEAVRLLSDTRRLAWLAQKITNITLEGKVMGVCLSLEEEKKKRQDFLLNFYECLRWVNNTLKTNVPREIESLRMDMDDNKNFYLKALSNLKEELKNLKELKGRDDVIDVIRAAINFLMKKI